MQVRVLVGVSDRSGDRNGSAGGGLATASASTTAAGGLVLVVDPCVVGDGRVVQVAAWVKKGDVDACLDPFACPLRKSLTEVVPVTWVPPWG